MMMYVTNYVTFRQDSSDQIPSSNDRLPRPDDRLSHPDDRLSHPDNGFPNIDDRKDAAGQRINTDDRSVRSDDQGSSGEQQHLPGLGLGSPAGQGHDYQPTPPVHGQFPNRSAPVQSPRHQPQTPGHIQSDNQQLAAVCGPGYSQLSPSGLSRQPSNQNYYQIVPPVQNQSSPLPPIQTQFQTLPPVQDQFQPLFPVQNQNLQLPPVQNNYQPLPHVQSPSYGQLAFHHQPHQPPLQGPVSRDDLGAGHIVELDGLVRLGVEIRPLSPSELTPLRGK